MTEETIVLPTRAAGIHAGLTTALMFFEIAMLPPAEMEAEFKRQLPDLGVGVDDPHLWLMQHASEAVDIVQAFFGQVLANSPPLPPRDAASSPPMEPRK